jgi:hypothetical protein
MGVHTAAYFGKLLKGGESTPIPAVPDQILAFRNGAHVPSIPAGLIATAAIGGGTDLVLVNARLQSPKTVISPNYVRPVNQTAFLASVVFPSNPNISVQSRSPVVMREGEEIAAVTDLTGATPDGIVSVLAWFQDQHDSLPPGEAYWVRFTTTLSIVVADNGKWQNFPITFADSTTLPAGRYAVVGMHLQQPATSQGALCGRLVVPGSSFRPGAVFLDDEASITPTFASDGSFGVWTVFDAQMPPSLDVLASGAAAGEVTGYLKVIQLSR